MKKAVKAILLVIPAAACTVALLFHARKPEPLTIPAATETERTAFLRSCGWDASLFATQTVIVPDEDAVYTDYAALQRVQNLPLDRFAGKRAVLYTYTLRDSSLCAELLTADGVLIGAQCYLPEQPQPLPVAKG